MNKNLKSLLAMVCALFMFCTVGFTAACSPASEDEEHLQHIDADGDGLCDECGEKMSDDDGNGGDDDEQKTMTSVHLVASKTEYMRGEVLDISTLSVTAQYSDGDIGTIAVSDGTVTISAGDNDTLTLTEPGTVTVTFTYGSLSDSVEITVSSSALYKFEAEEAEIIDGSRGSPTVQEEVEGHISVGNLTQNIGASVVFNIWAEEASDAVLSISLGSAYNTVFTYYFQTTVNGETYNTEATVSGSNWTVFVDVELGELQLVKGLNAIAFTVYDNGDSGRSGNIDYITIQSEVELDWATDGQASAGYLSIADITLTGVGDSAEILPVFSGENTYPIEYSFEGDNISIENGVVASLVEETETLVTATTEYHEVTFVVTVEGEYGTLDIDDMAVATGQTVQLEPQFSNEEYASDIVYTYSEDGIVSISDGMLTALAVGTVTVTATTEYHQTAFTVTVYDPGYYQTYRFECEDGEFVEGTSGLPNTESYGTGTTVGSLNGNVGAGVTITVYAEEDCFATLTINIGTPYGVVFTDLFDIVLNGEIYATSARTTGGGWTTFNDVVIGEIRLSKGINTISILVNSNNENRAGNLDYIELSTYVTLASSEEQLEMGRLIIADITLGEVGTTETIIPIFTNPDYEGDITYSFDGENISIADGVVTGLVADTVTTVTATTDKFTTTFTVTVLAQ